MAQPCRVLSTLSSEARNELKLEERPIKIVPKGLRAGVLTVLFGRRRFHCLHLDSVDTKKLQKSCFVHLSGVSYFKEQPH